HGQVAIRDNRGIDLVAPKHFKRLTLRVVINAGEPGANKRVSACHALDEPTAGPHLNEVTARRKSSAAPHENPLPSQQNLNPRSLKHIRFIVAPCRGKKGQSTGV